MILRGVLASISAGALAATPLAAHAAPRDAAPVARDATPMEGEHLGGSPLIPIVLIALVLAAILALSSGDKSVSP